jgi:hypothetical protein
LVATSAANTASDVIAKPTASRTLFCITGQLVTSRWKRQCKSR